MNKEIRTLKLRHVNNQSIICSNCNKPKYMGYTLKDDSVFCTCKELHSVYDKRMPEKVLVPFENFYEYE